MRVVGVLGVGVVYEDNVVFTPLVPAQCDGAVRHILLAIERTKIHDIVVGARRGEAFQHHLLFGRRIVFGHLYGGVEAILFALHDGHHAIFQYMVGLARVEQVSALFIHHAYAHHIVDYGNIGVALYRVVVAATGCGQGAEGHQHDSHTLYHHIFYCFVHCLLLFLG